MKRKPRIEQAGLFDAPAWEQEAKINAATPCPEAAALGPRQRKPRRKGKPARWHPFGECRSESLPCPRCKGKVTKELGVTDAELQFIVEKTAVMTIPPKPPDAERNGESWIAFRAAVLVKFRDMHPSDARAKATRELAEFEAT